MADLLLDSDVVIEVLRENAEIAGELLRMRDGGWTIAYTPVAKAEIYHGVRASEEAAVARFFDSCRCLTITGEVGEKAGRYLSQFHASRGVETADALVAAAAYVHKARLFTLNRKHYPMKDVSFHAPPAASAGNWTLGDGVEGRSIADYRIRTSRPAISSARCPNLRRG